jgi:Holin of 3TMs, for gene-transfer release
MTEVVKSESEKKKEDWMNNKWRPMMGWSYMLTCIADFVAFPILWSLVQVIGGGRVETQWQPITLQGAGLYHIAMGAVLGIAAFGRTQEKIAGANNGGLPSPGNVGTTYTPSAPVSTPAPGFSAPQNQVALSTLAPNFGATTPTFGGKPGPVQPPHPEL